MQQRLQIKVGIGILPSFLFVGPVQTNRHSCSPQFMEEMARGGPRTSHLPFKYAKRAYAA
jgi:hypothetical protein